MNRRAIFDRVRKMLGRGFRADEVKALDRAMDEAEGRVTPDAPSEPEEPGIPVIMGAAGLALLKRFEGCERKRPDGLFEAYPDPGTGGAPWTIGWGATGPDVRPGTVWTQAQCDERLEHDMFRYAEDVSRAIGKTPTSQAQFDALVSFHYNSGAINRATLTRRHKAGDFAGAGAEFARWNRAGGRILAGLTRRRAAEAALYRSGS